MSFNSTHSVSFEDNIEGVIDGINEAAKIVTSTMGPFGHNVIVKVGDSVTIWKDGVSIMNMIRPKKPLERAGALLCIDASRRTEQIAGDGTTTTAAMIKAMAALIAEAKSSGENHWIVKKQIEEATEKAIKKIESLSRPINEKRLLAVAKTSVNNDEKLGKVIGDLLWKVKEDGVVDVKTSFEKETYASFSDGYYFHRGVLDPSLLGGHPEIELHNPVIFMCNDTIDDARYFTDYFFDYYKSLSLKGNAFTRPLLIICKDAQGSFLSYVTRNISNLPVYVVGAPQSGERRELMMGDIQQISGTQFVLDEQKGIKWENMAEEFNVDSFGEAEKVILSNTETTIFFKKDQRTKDQVQNRIQGIDQFLNDDKNKEDLEGRPEYKDWLLRRKLSLQYGLATLYIKATTTTDTDRIKKNVDDAVLACKTAMRTSVLPGAGTALYKVACEMDKSNIGEKFVAEALKSPLRTVLENAGYTGEDAIDKFGFSVSKPWMIPNLNKGTGLLDAEKDGILDTMGTAEEALRNAVSIITQLLTSKYVGAFQDE